MVDKYIFAISGFRMVMETVLDRPRLVCSAQRPVFLQKPDLLLSRLLNSRKGYRKSSLREHLAVVTARRIYAK